MQGELVTVFGCGGDRDRDKRQLMGRVACELSDRVVLTSDNPRSESPAEILRDIESGCSGDYLSLEDRAEAIRHALTEARPGEIRTPALSRIEAVEQALAALAGRAGQ